MVKAENLCFSYTGSHPYILENIKLTVNKGEYISVLGDNGSGKSTLIKLIIKFLSPSSGNISLGTDKIGYVPQKQDFINSQFPITVFEMMNSYRRLLKIKDKDIVFESLKLVKMLDYQNALIGTLSAGQCQKVFVARALMGNPELLVLDEPSTGVDREGQRELYGIISALNKDKGITVISVEHNLEAAIKNSSKIFHIVENKGHMCSPKKYADEYLKEKIWGDMDV